MAPPYGPESFWGAFHHMMLDVGFVSRGPEKAAFWMAIWLAFFNQVRCCRPRSLQCVTSALPHCFALGDPCRMPLRCRRALQRLSSTMRPACWKSAACSGMATPYCTPPASALARCLLSDLWCSVWSNSYSKAMHTYGSKLIGLMSRRASSPLCFEEFMLGVATCRWSGC